MNEQEKERWAERLLKLLVGCLAVVTVTLGGGYMGVLGAAWAGWKAPSSGSFDLSGLAHALNGLVCGGIGFVIVFALSSIARRVPLWARINLAVILALGSAFFGGIVGYK